MTSIGEHFAEALQATIDNNGIPDETIDSFSQLW